MVITETSKTLFERVNIDFFEYPSRNYELTIIIIQAHPLKDKKASTAINSLLTFFQPYATPIRIHRDYMREPDNTLMKILGELYNTK